MIWRDISCLLRLYHRFFLRKVFNTGILKDRRHRLLLLGLFAMATVTMSVLFYLFLDGSVQRDENYRFILSVYGLTTVLYTVLLFIFMKVLFLKSADLSLLTVQLPVTNQVRRSSLLTFEISTVFFGIFLLTLSFLSAFVVKTGGSYGSEILTAIVLTSITTYNLLNFAYLLFFWVLERLSIAVSQYFISSLLFTVLLILAVNMQSGWLDSLIKGYFDQQDYLVMPLVLLYLAQKSHFLVSFFFFLMVNSGLIVLSYHLSTNQAIETKKYGNLFSFNLNRITLFKSYLIRVFRLKENQLLALLTVLGYALGVYYQVEMRIFIFVFLSLNSAYAFIQTKSLRVIQKTAQTYVAIKEYSYLLTSHVVYMIVIASPFLLLDLGLRQDPLSLLFFLGSAICSVIYLMLIGILFPPTHDNPMVIISSLLGLAVGDDFLVTLSGQFLMIYGLGLILPYTLHEYFHAKLLLWFKVAIKIEQTVFRVSILPLTQLSAFSGTIVALVGPLGVVLIGLLLHGITLTIHGINLNFLAYFYLSHLMFLLPFFGDGQVVLINSLRYFRRIFNGSKNQ